MTEQYRKPKIAPIINYVLDQIEENPELLNDRYELKARLFHAYPELQEKKKCANCDASMLMYIYKLDYHNARLLERMGDEVLKNKREGMDLTQANQIHVPTLETTDAIRHRTTQASKLGLIAKTRRPGRKTQVPGTWSVTKRGFAALRGERVPAEVTCWRKEIEERSDKTTTLSEVFNRAAQDMRQRMKQGKKSDPEKLSVTYAPSDYYHIGEAHQGKIL